MAIKAFGKSRNLKQMQNSLSSMTLYDKALARFGGVSFNKNKMLKFIARNLEKKVQAALMRSLAKSGVKRKSGMLARAVQSSDVWIQGGKIRISLRAGWPDSLYRYASSINYGAVRNSQGLGGKAKRTVKKSVLSGKKMTNRQRARLDRGVTQTHDGITRTHGPVDIGGVKVVRPKPFFYISDADRREILAEFTSLMQRWVRGELRIPSAGRRGVA